MWWCFIYKAGPRPFILKKIHLEVRYFFHDIHTNDDDIKCRIYFFFKSTHTYQFKITALILDQRKYISYERSLTAIATPRWPIRFLGTLSYANLKESFVPVLQRNLPHLAHPCSLYFLFFTFVYWEHSCSCMSRHLDVEINPMFGSMPQCLSHVVKVRQ